MKAILALVMVFGAMIVVWKAGEWLGERLTGVFYVLMVRRSYGEQLLNEYYKEAFYDFMNRQFESASFMQIIGFIVERFMAVILHGSMAIGSIVIVIICARTLSLPGVELTVPIMLEAAVVLGLLSIVLNTLSVIRAVSAIVRTYCEDVAKTLELADEAGRQAE